MWVYKKINNGCFQVGYWTPRMEWYVESEHETAELAAAHVHYLNGGNANG